MPNDEKDFLSAPSFLASKNSAHCLALRTIYAALSDIEDLLGERGYTGHEVNVTMPVREPDRRM